MHFTFIAETDIGTTKDTNQDSILVKHGQYSGGEVLMAIVCDGMGGLSKGELASATVIRAFDKWFDEELPYELEELDLHVISGKWNLMLKDLNVKLIEYSRNENITMGTTFTGILFVNNQYVISHVDNVCAFTSPGHVVLAWTDDMDDPQYKMSSADLEILENETDARGRKIEVHKVYIPKNPVCITEYELSGFTFEEGEDEREAGERLAASYVNFYITNGGVLIPQFGDVMDEPALKAIGSLFEGRKVYPIYARDIIVGGGNIHCITQQIPQ